MINYHINTSLITIDHMVMIEIPRLYWFVKSHVIGACDAIGPGLVWSENL